MSTDCYVTTLAVTDIFADLTYQRPLDQARARKLAKEWDRRLAGIVEVSDRGPHHRVGRPPVVRQMREDLFVELIGSHRMPPCIVDPPISRRRPLCNDRALVGPYTRLID